jgi:hypothetical protein
MNRKTTGITFYISDEENQNAGAAASLTLTNRKL